MIVQRVISKVKPGNRDAYVEMLKAARQALDDPNSMRIFTPLIGVPFTTVVYKLTAESVAENQQGWDEWYANPETQGFMEKWFELVEDSMDEFYTVEA